MMVWVGRAIRGFCFYTFLLSLFPFFYCIFCFIRVFSVSVSVSVFLFFSFFFFSSFLPFFFFFFSSFLFLLDRFLGFLFFGFLFGFLNLFYINN